MQPLHVLVLLALAALAVEPAVAGGSRVLAPSIHVAGVVLADAPFPVSGLLGTSVDAGGNRVNHAHREAGRTIEILVDGEVRATAITDADGRYRATLTLPRGAHELAARVADDELSVPEEPMQVVAATPASAPRALRVHQGPLVGEASLTWEPPLDDGGAPVTSYSVRASPARVDPWRPDRSPTPTSRVVLVEPGQAYTFDVVAHTDPRLPAGAASDAWTGVPPRPDVEAITLAYERIRVCTWTATGRTVCEDVAPGGIARAPTGFWFADAYLRGSVAGASGPAAGVVVAAGMGPANASSTYFRVVTDADGAFAFEGGSNAGNVVARCVNEPFTAHARMLDVVVEARTTVRICRAADVPLS